MRGPVNVIVYVPKNEESKQRLASRVADVHANGVHQRLKSLDCPDEQKLALLDAVIEDARKKAQQGLLSAEKLENISLFDTIKT